MHCGAPSSVPSDAGSGVPYSPAVITNYVSGHCHMSHGQKPTPRDNTGLGLLFPSLLLLLYNHWGHLSRPLCDSA